MFIKSIYNELINYVNTLLMSCIKTIVNVVQELIQNVFLKHTFKINFFLE